MHLKFNAQEVTYAEALGGDLVQVSFQEEPDPDIDYSKKNHPLPQLIKSLSFSACYEFPPYDTTVEWCDGDNYSGGELIRKVELSKTCLKVELENEYRFDVSFEIDDITFKNIQRFLIVTNQ